MFEIFLYLIFNGNNIRIAGTFYIPLKMEKEIQPFAFKFFSIVPTSHK